MATVNQTPITLSPTPSSSTGPREASFVPPASSEPKQATFVPPSNGSTDSSASTGAGAVVVGVVVVAAIAGIYFATRRSAPVMSVTVNGQRTDFTRRQVDALRHGLKANGRWVEL